MILDDTGRVIFNFSLINSLSLIMACDPGYLTQGYYVFF